MADSLSSADPLHGVCGVCVCGSKSVLIAHTLVGLSYDNDGVVQDDTDLAIIRIDSRHAGPTHTEAVLHEFLHVRFEEWKEEPILELGKQLAALLHLPEVKRRSFG